MLFHLIIHNSPLLEMKAYSIVSQIMFGCGVMKWIINYAPRPGGIWNENGRDMG